MLASLTTACIVAGLSLATSVMAAPAMADLMPTTGVEIQNVATGLCLDDGNQAGPAYGQGMYDCNYKSWVNGYQNWNIIYNQPYEIQNPRRGDCLDDSWQFGLRFYACVPASFTNGYQAFILRWTVTGQQYMGAFTMQNLDQKNQGTKLCVDDSQQYGLRAIQCSTPPAPYQLWRAYIPN